MQSIKGRLEASGLSRDADSIVMSLWRPHTQTLYDVYLRKRKRYASEQEMDSVSSSSAEGVNFLAALGRDKASLSSVSAARSALGCFLCYYEGVIFGNTDLARRFIKGTFEQNPTFPKQLKRNLGCKYCVTHAEHLDASRQSDPNGAKFEVSDAYGSVAGTKVSNVTRTGHSTHHCWTKSVHSL